MINIYHAFAHLVNLDLGSRGIKNVFYELMSKGALNLEKIASRILDYYERPMILTGFPIPPHHIAETDGPLGALAFAIALEEIGGRPIIVAERTLFEPLRKIWNRTISYEETNSQKPSFVISIEVPGRASDGKYYSMRGLEVKCDPLDEILLKYYQKLYTIGIGDGGNEAGLGTIRELIVKHVPLGEKISSIVPANDVFIGATSNWAVYAIVAAISIKYGKDLLKNFDEGYYLKALVEEGIIDGVLGASNVSVDGIPLDISKNILELLRKLIKMRL